MYSKDIIKLCLQLFADGAESGVTGAAAVSPSGDTSPNAVVYGKQEEAPAAEVQNEETPPVVDRNAEFEKLIRGEYKDLYNAKVQSTVQQRLKATKDTVDKYNAFLPTMELLGKRYGVDIKDTDALVKAIEDDDAYWEREAADRGSTVEDVKRLYKAERDASVMRRQMEERQARDEANKQYNAWMQAAEEIRGIYPAFDLEGEMGNPQFTRLLRNGVDMRTAFEVIHKDEILPAAMRYAAKETERRVTASIAAGAARPSENGNSSQSAARVKSDPSALTSRDFEEIRRRVNRGEKISF